jgi:hypothetical protein
MRGVALAIAAAAVIDPIVSSNRTTKPVVLVTAADSGRDDRLADEVSKALDGAFTVARKPIAGASAAVVVGGVLPRDDAELPALSFVIVSNEDEPRVDVDHVDIPSTATLDGRVPIRVKVATRGASGRSLNVALRVGGAVVDRVTRRLNGDSALTIPMSFVPSALGPVVIRVSASVDGADSPALADAAVDVVDATRAVLFYDPRPSWMSTFVRRTVERDPRFTVSSRTLTSRGVGADAGRPPSTLQDWARLASFDAVVIGAPQLLSAADVAGVEAFMRRRGGSVIFLLDDAAPGPYERLTRASGWSSSRGTPAAFSLAGSDSASIRASEIVAPAALPFASTPIAGSGKPVVWETPVGAGRLIVSGAVDAWRFRDRSASSFDRFWRMVIADAATSAPQRLIVEPAVAVVAPGESLDMRATIRDLALDSTAVRGSSTRASIAATIGRETQVRMWPEGTVGRFRANVRVPRQPGLYHLAVASEGHTAEVPVIVLAGARTVSPAPRALLSAWASAHGGRLFQSSDIGALPAALGAAIRPTSGRTTWHPFRSAWWIVPFVLSLSLEWWLRRRQGLQ